MKALPVNAASSGLFPIVKHIPEIDGLRAIAVLSVLLYHVNAGWLSGGYVGVDVFFVISGYLISNMLLTDVTEGRLSLKRFYVRRILRIAPALFVTLAVTALVFFALFPPVWSRELLISLASALLSFSNLWFYSTVDYFANNATSPVLHTWSLAVEEQFYLCIPLLLLAISRKGWIRFKIPIFGTLLIASLLASIAAAHDPGQSGYFLPWLRAWELLCGTMLACARIENLSRPIKQVVSIAGVAMILLACYLYDDFTPFPGYTALLPCVGAVGVIAGASGGGVANRILQTGFMRWVGKISYSLYLVHWPLICAASLTVTLHPGKVKALVIASSFGLAWLSWRYVETPFRRMAGRVPETRVLVAFASCCVILLAGFAALQFANTQFWNLYPTARGYTEFLKTDQDFFRSGTCFVTRYHEGIADFRNRDCLTQDPAKTNVVLLGDSHAANIWEALAGRFPSIHLLQATTPACKPVLDTGGSSTCRELMHYIFGEWIDGDGAPVRNVILAARWEPGDIEPLKRTILRLQKSGRQVIVYGPVPEYYVAVPLLLAFGEISGIDLRSRLFTPNRLDLDKRLRTELGGLATYFSPFANICKGTDCRLVYDGEPVFSDRDHMTRAGARLAIDGFPLQ